MTHDNKEQAVRDGFCPPNNDTYKTKNLHQINNRVNNLNSQQSEIENIGNQLNFSQGIASLCVQSLLSNEELKNTRRN